MLVIEAALLPPVGYQADGAGRGSLMPNGRAARFADAAGYTDVKTRSPRSLATFATLAATAGPGRADRLQDAGHAGPA